MLSENLWIISLTWGLLRGTPPYVHWRVTAIATQGTWVPETDKNRKLTKAFVLLGVSSYMGIELSEAFSLITEGGNDSGIDAIFIGDTLDFEFQVTIFQAKLSLNILTIKTLLNN